MVIYHSTWLILIQWVRVIIVRWQSDIVSTRHREEYFLFVMNLITRTKDKYRRGGLTFCGTVYCIVLWGSCIWRYADCRLRVFFLTNWDCSLINVNIPVYIRYTSRYALLLTFSYFSVRLYLLFQTNENRLCSYILLPLTKDVSWKI